MPGSCGSCCRRCRCWRSCPPMRSSSSPPVSHLRPRPASWSPESPWRSCTAFTAPDGWVLPQRHVESPVCRCRAVPRVGHPVVHDRARTQPQRQRQVYSGRLTLRFDLLDPEWLDRALEALERLGFTTYALLEDWEETAFRQGFSGARALQLLEAGPVANRRSEGRAPSVRAEGTCASAGRWPLEIPRTSRFECTQPSPRFAQP